MKRRRLEENEIIALAAIVLVVLTMVVGFVSMVREHARCTDNGGHYERLNCRAYEDWVTDGDGNSHTETGTTCDCVCVGASAEDGR